MSAANDPLAEPVPPDSAVLTSTSSPRCSASTARPSTTPFFAEKYRGSPRRDHVPHFAGGGDRLAFVRSRSRFALEEGGAGN